MHQLCTHTFVFAGGLGTRLRAKVSDVPKPMAPTGGKPFLARLLGYWTNQGIKHFTLSVGYLGNIIQEYFGKNFCGASVDYITEDSPLGTGGALRKAFSCGVFDDSTTIVLNGDTWFEASLPRLLESPDKTEFAMTLALRRVTENTRYGGIALWEDGSVRAFGDPHSLLINAGCYAMQPPRLAPLLANYPEKFSLEADLLPCLAKKGYLNSCVQDVVFIDIGIPEDYEKFCASLYPPRV